MKGLKFLLYLSILFLLVLLFLVPFYYSDISTFLSDFNNGRKTLESTFSDLSSYLQHIDIWNIIWLCFLASCIMITHAGVETFFLNKLNKFYSGNFIADGLLWSARRILSLLITMTIFIFISNTLVYFYSNVRIMSELEDVKKQKYVVLLLGTNKYLKDGKSENVYFTNRIDAVIELYKAGYVKKIVISGDKDDKDYNEPADMMLSLIKKGVPKSLILLDVAGFRTLDSIVRSKNEFGFNDLLVVSQGFHLQRALFLSWNFGVEAIGFEASGNMNLAMFKREYLGAVPKMILDIMVLNTQPENGSTKARRKIGFSEKDIIYILSIVIFFFISLRLSYDAFNFGK